MDDSIYVLRHFYDSELKRPIDKVEINFSKQSELTIGIKSPIPILSDQSVEESHFKLSKNAYENSILITNLSLFGTYFKIKHSVPTKMPYGEYITIGRTWILPTASTEHCKLLFIDENYVVFKTEHIKFGKTVIIGSSQNDDITLADQSVSRSHLKVKVEKDFIVVIDYKQGKGSTNGTWVAFPKGEMHGRILDLRLGIETFAKLEKITKPSIDDFTEKINDNAMSFLPVYKDFDTQIAEEEKKQIVHTYSAVSEYDASTNDLIALALNLNNNDSKAADELMKNYKRLSQTPSELVSIAPAFNIEMVKLVYLKMGFNKQATINYFRQIA
jgi:hypothetical protein